MKTPVLFLIFNRPETTRRVFAAIRKAQPEQLFIAGDGPRPGVPGDAEKCEQARRIVTEVDWDCRVSTLLREENLGCRSAVSSAIDWFFANNEEGIVLEDDCLPAHDFFGYCESLLARYRHDTRIMQVSGSNLVNGGNKGGYSYFFSNYGPVWGWASWRRAWQAYDVAMKVWPEVREKKVYEDFCQSPAEAQYRLGIYDKVYAGAIDTWDYQWGFAKMINGGLSATPAVNLIKNIGFGVDSTHTNGQSPFADLQLNNLELPLRHPPYIVRDREHDAGFNSLYLPAPQETVFTRTRRLLTGR